MSVPHLYKSCPTSSGRSLSHPMPVSQYNASIMLSQEESQRRRIVDQNGLAEYVLHNVRENPRGLVIALDIDQCSALGEDTFDILRIVQHLTDFFNEPRSRAKILEVARLLINPEMINAVNQLKQEFPDIQPYILFFTAKSSIVDLFNPVTPANPIPNANAQLLNDHGFFVSGTGGLDIMKFSAGNLFDGWTYLYKQIQTRLSDALPPEWAPQDSNEYDEMAKLGLLTWAASLVLGLPYSAPVYITKIGKDLSIIRRDLQIEDPRKIILFDDKAGEHAENLGMSLAEARMIQVQQFRYETMTPPRAEQLIQYLRQHFPITQEFVQEHSGKKGLIEQTSKPTVQWPFPRLALQNTTPEGGPLMYNWRSKVGIAGKIPVQPWALGLVKEELPTAASSWRPTVHSDFASMRFGPGYDAQLLASLKRERSADDDTHEDYKRPATSTMPRSYTGPFFPR